MSSEVSTAHAVVTEVPASVLVQNLCKYAAIFGIILGGVSSTEGLALVIALVLRFRSGWLGGPWVVVLLRYSAALVSAGAAILLFAGSIGWLSRKPRGRVLMLVYAWLALLATSLMTVSRVLEIAFGGFRFPRTIMAVMLLDALIAASSAVVFPLCVIVLMKLDARRPPHGFEPIMTVSQ